MIDEGEPSIRGQRSWPRAEASQGIPSLALALSPSSRRVFHQRRRRYAWPVVIPFHPPRLGRGGLPLPASDGGACRAASASHAAPGATRGESLRRP